MFLHDSLHTLPPATLITHLLPLCCHTPSFSPSATPQPLTHLVPDCSLYYTWRSRVSLHDLLVLDWYFGFIFPSACLRPACLLQLCLLKKPWHCFPALQHLKPSLIESLVLCDGLGFKPHPCQDRCSTCWSIAILSSTYLSVFLTSYPELYLVYASRKTCQLLTTITLYRRMMDAWEEGNIRFNSALLFRIIAYILQCVLVQWK